SRPGRARTLRRRGERPYGRRDPPGCAAARQQGALMGLAARMPGLARLAGAVMAFLLCFSLAAFAAETFDTQPLTIVTKDGRSHAFTVELAVTPRQREQGLMHRREMAPDHGMLFAFGETRQVFMWMKNTYLPLDMLFITRDG